MEETWKPVNNFEGCYEVSNLGRVRSVERIITYSDGRAYKYEQRILNQTLNKKRGYFYVKLSKNMKTKNVQVHRVVAETFLQNKNNKNVVNHIDGNKQNNKVSNLEWISSKENSEHAVKKGLTKSGHLSHRARFSKEEVLEMRRKYTSGVRQTDIAKEYGTDDSTMFAILKLKTYKNI